MGHVRLDFPQERRTSAVPPQRERQPASGSGQPVDLQALAAPRFDPAGQEVEVGGVGVIDERRDDGTEQLRRAGRVITGQISPGPDAVGGTTKVLPQRRDRRIHQVAVQARRIAASCNTPRRARRADALAKRLGLLEAPRSVEYRGDRRQMALRCDRSTPSELRQGRDGRLHQGGRHLRIEPGVGRRGSDKLAWRAPQKHGIEPAPCFGDVVEARELQRRGRVHAGSYGMGVGQEVTALGGDQSLQFGVGQDQPRDLAELAPPAARHRVGVRHIRRRADEPI